MKPYTLFITFIAVMWTASPLLARTAKTDCLQDQRLESSACDTISMVQDCSKATSTDAVNYCIDYRLERCTNLKLKVGICAILQKMEADLAKKS